MHFPNEKVNKQEQINIKINSYVLKTIDNQCIVQH